MVYDLSPRQLALAGEFVKEGHAMNDALQMAREAGDPATTEPVRGALTALYEWYDRDGSVGGAAEVFEKHRSVLAPAGDTGREALVAYRMAQKWASGTAAHQMALAEADGLNPLPPWYDLAKDASPQPDARIGREVIERCAKIADPWPGYPTTEPNTYDIKLSEVDKAVIAVRKEIASKIRALTARDAGECTDPRAERG